jgi:hypothetical protein
MTKRFVKPGFACLVMALEEPLIHWETGNEERSTLRDPGLYV